MRQNGYSLGGRAGVIAITAALILPALILTHGTAAPVAAPITVRSESTGYASWILPTKERGRYEWLALQVSVEDGVDGGEAVTEFVAIRGRCRSGGKGAFACTGAGRIHPFDLGAFEMEPDLSAASLDVIAAGKRYRARWNGHQIAPGAYSRSEICVDAEGDEEYGEGGGLWRHADARANFAGKELAPATHEHALTFLARGAVVTQCGKNLPRVTERHGGEVTVTWRAAGH